MLNQISVHPVAQLRLHTKLTISDTTFEKKKLTISDTTLGKKIK